jgi:hypothetical protein
MNLLLNSKESAFLKLSHVLSMPSFALVHLYKSLLLLAVFYVIVALAEAKWGPAKEPWFKFPPDYPPASWTGFATRVNNLFPLGRKASFIFWIVVLLTSLGLTAFELQSRLSAGDWPRIGDEKHGVEDYVDDSATGLLALAVFYGLVSMFRLVRMSMGRR